MRWAVGCFGASARRLRVDVSSGFDSWSGCFPGAAVETTVGPGGLCVLLSILGYVVKHARSFRYACKPVPLSMRFGPVMAKRHVFPSEGLSPAKHITAVWRADEAFRPRQKGLRVVMKNFLKYPLARQEVFLIYYTLVRPKGVGRRSLKVGV